MPSVWTMGEILVEVMRPREDMPLGVPGEFMGPFPSGAPAIFIDTVARLGHSAGMIGGVGEDDFGRCVTERLERDGVDCRYVKAYAGPATGVAFVTYRSDGSRQFIYHIGNTPAVYPKAPTLPADDTAKFFHVMGCSLLANKEFSSEITKAAQDFIRRGAKISFDPNIRPELLRGGALGPLVDPIMQRCSVFQPGVAELLMIADAPTVEDAVAKLFQNPVLEVIALKRGSSGSTIYTGSDVIQVGAYQVNPVDPTGAGDVFDAAFLCGLLEGLPLRDCALKASAAAALNTEALGPMEGDINPRTVAALIDAQRL